MTKQLNNVGTPADTDYATAYLFFELSKANWHLGVMLPGSTKMSRYTIAGGDTVRLSLRLDDIRAKAGRSGKPVRILSCYEAGLDSHWLHRGPAGPRGLKFGGDRAGNGVHR